MNFHGLTGRQLKEGNGPKVLERRSNAVDDQTSWGTTSKEDAGVLQRHFSVRSPRLRAILLQAPNLLPLSFQDVLEGCQELDSANVLEVR